MKINTLKYNRFGGYIINGVISCPLTGSEFDEEITAWLLTNTPEEADPEPPPDKNQIAQTESEVWFAANAGALALFNLAMATLESEVNALVDAVIPLATAANKTKLKRLLMAGAVLDRAQVKRDGLG